MEVGLFIDLWVSMDKILSDFKVLKLNLVWESMLC